MLHTPSHHHEFLLEKVWAILQCPPLALKKEIKLPEWRENIQVTNSLHFWDLEVFLFNVRRVKHWCIATLFIILWNHIFTAEWLCSLKTCHRRVKCKICNSLATGVHFGVLSCYGCKVCWLQGLIYDLTLLQRVWCKAVW